MRGRVLQIFDCDLVEIVGALDEMLVHGTQHVRDVHGLGGAGIELIDLSSRERRIRPRGHAQEGLLPQGPREVTMQLDLRDRLQEFRKREPGHERACSAAVRKKLPAPAW